MAISTDDLNAMIELASNGETIMWPLSMNAKKARKLISDGSSDGLTHNRYSYADLEQDLADIIDTANLEQDLADITDAGMTWPTPSMLKAG